MGAQFFDMPYCKEFITWEYNGVNVYDLCLTIPTTCFLLFLLFKLRSSIRKLLETESMIMSTYYGFLWCVCLFNISRSLLNYVVPNNPMLYNSLFMIANFILIFVEVSVVVFMSHGHMVSGREAIQRTVWITAAICVIYIVLQAVFLFGLGLQLYQPTSDSGVQLYWFILGTVFALGYLIILILPKTSLKDRLPARPAFYHYVGLLFALNITKALGSILIFAGGDIGFCFVDLGVFGYFSLYAPTLYICFLQDFFGDMTLSDGYVEMEKSGYLDTDT